MDHVEAIEGTGGLFKGFSFKKRARGQVAKKTNCAFRGKLRSARLAQFQVSILLELDFK